MKSTVLHGRKVVGGVVEGQALVTRQQVSGWGGIDPSTGTIIESRHELRGVSFAGKVLVFPGAKGSSKILPYCALLHAMIGFGVVLVFFLMVFRHRHVHGVA